MSPRRAPGTTRRTRHMIRRQGLASSEYLPVLGGLMAMHRAVSGQETPRSA